jgi:predicted RNA-binding protein with PIN domain
MKVEHLVIDGYALLHRLPEARPLLGTNLPLAREKLLRTIEPVAGLYAPRMTVVFDGRERAADPHHDHAAVRVVFTGTGETADHHIEALVLAHAQPSSVLVVTADRAEINCVLAAGGQVMSCREFIELCARHERDTARRTRPGKGSPGNSLGDYFP